MIKWIIKIGFNYRINFDVKYDIVNVCLNDVE